MGVYKDRVSYKDHNFATSVLTINGVHNAEGMESVEVELDEDETTIQKVADGTGIFVKGTSRSGTFKFQILEASATNDVMWALRQADTAFKLSFADPTSPNLDCHGNVCRVLKAPVVKRGKEADVVEWVCNSIYLDVKGGSYLLTA